MLDLAELTILTSWAEAVAEALYATAGDVEGVLSDAAAGAPWRRALGLEQPSDRLSSAIEAMAQLVRCLTTGDRAADGLLPALRARERDRRDPERLPVGVLRSALEQRVTRAATDRGPFPARLVG